MGNHFEMVDKLYITITPFFPSKDKLFYSYVYDQVQAIERNSDYKVIVFRPKSPWEKFEDYQYEGVKVYYFNAFEMPSLILNGIFNGVNSRFFIDCVKQLGIDVSQIVVAHGHTSQFAAYALALKKINSRIKAVVQHHDCDPYTIRNGKWAQKRWNAIYRAQKSIELFEKVDLHLCISDFVKDSLMCFPNPPKNLYYDSYRKALTSVEGVRSPIIKDTYTLYNGVDCNKFFPQKTALVGDECSREKFTIGCVANFVELKDQMTLLRAIKILRDNGDTSFKVVFVGSGVNLSECQRFIGDNDLSGFVKIKSEIHHSELNKFYNQLDLFVLPSFFEGFGCVCTEAAACGVPFMICKHQGAAEYIIDEDKWLFEPHDYNMLAKLISNYKVARYKQVLRYSYNINDLIEKYLIYLNQIV